VKPAHPCKIPELRDFAGYYVADVVQGIVNEDENKRSRRGENDFVKSALCFGAFLFLEGFKSSINYKLCTPLKPLAKKSMPDYHYSVQQEAEEVHQ
jgi:hypothetical protein